jgi:hypothetical protein
MSYYIVIRWDTIQDGWILIVVMTVIYKCEDMLKNRETLPIFFFDRDRKMPYF